MIRPDAAQLREFYSSSLGRQVRRYLQQALKERWPSLNGDIACGLGYAGPCLRPYLRFESSDDTSSVVLAMPKAQGGTIWPDYQHNRVALITETQLPFHDHHINRLLLVHALEHAADYEALLEECWRVLVPGGRMLVITPHRRTMWASAPHTPFSYGKPYSVSQLRETLCNELFTHVHTSTSLFFTPTERRFLQRFNSSLQRVGSVLYPMFGGVVVMEVEKQLYAGIKQRAQPVRTKGLGALGQPALPKLNS